MNKNTRIVFAAFALVAAAGLAACKSDNSAANDHAMEAKATPINTTCPYSHKAVNPAVTSVHEGKTMGFCCANCKGNFDKASDAEQHEMVAHAK